MSVDSARRKVLSHQKTIASLQQDKTREADRVAQLTKKASSAQQAASRTKSASIIRSKYREIEQCQGGIAAAQKRIATLEGKIAREYRSLANAQKELEREERHELNQRIRDEKKRTQDSQRRMSDIDNTLRVHHALHEEAMSAIEQLRSLPERIVVLFLASNPVDEPQLRLDEEARSIAEMIRKSRHRDAVKLESCWAIRPLDVLQAINEHNPRIIHFSGHGSDQDEIVFQDDFGQSRLVTKEAIVQTFLATSGEISLVFFNTCFSHSQAEAVVKHVKAAIGMKVEIGDEAARVFAAQFYSAVGFGKSVKVSFEQAKAALMLAGIPEENTPVLFLADGVEADQLVLVRPPDIDAATS